MFATSNEQGAWLAYNRVTDVGPDHLGRTSIPVADAMRLYPVSAMRAARDEIERAAAAGNQAARLADLNARRREAFERELYAAARRGELAGRAHDAARKALERVEADLDEATRKQLRGVHYNMSRLAMAEMSGLERTQHQEAEVGAPMIEHAAGARGGDPFPAGWGWPPPVDSSASNAPPGSGVTHRSRGHVHADP